MKKYQDDSLTLHTDLYQINMAETYFKDGIAEKRQSLKCISENYRSEMVIQFLRA